MAQPVFLSPYLHNIVTNWKIKKLQGILTMLAWLQDIGTETDATEKGRGELAITKVNNTGYYK